MTRNVWGSLCFGLVLACGCSKPTDPANVASAPGGAEQAPDRAVETAPDTEIAATAPASQETEHAADDDSPAAQGNGHVELKLEGIRFRVPGDWRQVKPQTNIVEAEFELPHVDGDEHDGRLTLMFSGGDPDEVISNRTAEFIHDADHPPKLESVMIGETEGRWVDLRGEWKGPSFRPIEPRPEYRMLLVIIPCTAHSSFYVKLTGPQETIAAHEEHFREFVESARLAQSGYE